MKFLLGMMKFFGLILAGILLSFAHPFRDGDLVRENSWWTVLVASLGLALFMMLATGGRTKPRRFGRGVLGGFAFFAVTLHWLLNALEIFGGIQPWLSMIVASLLAGYCALFYGLWAMIAGMPAVCERSPWTKAIAWASLWTFLEAMRQYLLTGFGWGELGYQFHFIPWIRESASIWGVHGLTFVWVFLVSLIIDFDHIARSHFEKVRVAISIGIILLICIGARLSLKLYPTDSQIRVSLLQPDVAQEDKWASATSVSIVEKLLTMTEASIKEGAELIVWPETAYPRLVGAQQRQLPFSTAVPLVMGAVVRDGQVNRNSALLVDKDQIIQRFDKEHLVPFGEFVPLAKYMPFGKLVANVGDFEPGSKEQGLLNVASKNLNLGPLICYEDGFSRSSARLANQGANLLLNLTNDAWYGVSSAQSQHAAMSSFQVYQTFLPMLRATNNGLTTFILPTHRIDQTNFVQAIGTETVAFQAKPKKTFFVWTYPLMEWIWLVIFGLSLLLERGGRSRRIFFRR